MTDQIQAINYIKQYIKTLESDRARVDDEIKAIEVQKDAIVLKRNELTASKSAFLKKTDGYGKEVKRVDALYALACKMKLKADEDTLELSIDRKQLDEREKKIINLEAKQKQLEDKEKLIKVKESDIEERELLVEKDKKANRAKQQDLDLRAKSIKNKQEQLQRMIDNTKV